MAFARVHKIVCIKTVPLVLVSLSSFDQPHKTISYFLVKIMIWNYMPTLRWGRDTNCLYDVKSNAHVVHGWSKNIRWMLRSSGQIPRTDVLGSSVHINWFTQISLRKCASVVIRIYYSLPTKFAFHFRIQWINL